jgi:hypothetical protein
VLTFGAAPSPVTVYQGKTDKTYMRPATATADGVVPPEQSPCSCDPGAEDGSSGSRQRVTPRCT